MYQAIQTKYFGPSNVRGARVKASCDAKTMWWSWDHSKGVDSNHIAAANALALKLGWTGKWYGGSLPGTGYAFVLCSPTASPVPDFTIDVGTR